METILYIIIVIIALIIGCAGFCGVDRFPEVALTVLLVFDWLAAFELADIIIAAIKFLEG